MTEDKAGVIDHLNIRSSYSESKRLCGCLCVSYTAEYGMNVKFVRLAQALGAGVSLSDNWMPMQFAKPGVQGKTLYSILMGGAYPIMSISQIHLPVF